jgi:hypothetical protein
MKNRKREGHEKSLRQHLEQDQRSQKVKWSESPAVKRDRSKSRVMSTKEPLDIIHEASGKWQHALVADFKFKFATLLMWCTKRKDFQPHIH